MLQVRGLRFLFLLCLGGIRPGAAAAEVPARVEFNRDIRPILSVKCFACHGTDARHRKTGLRLDTEDGARADLGDHAAVVAGKPQESAVVARITSPKRGQRMPPAKSGKELSAREIELIRRWIEQGAVYQPH